MPLEKKVSFLFLKEEKIHSHKINMLHVDDAKIDRSAIDEVVIWIINSHNIPYIDLTRIKY